MHRNIIGILTAATGVISLLSGGCGRSGNADSREYQNAEGMIWNTTYHVTYNGAPELKDSIMQVLNHVGTSLNVFDEKSLVSRVNVSDSTAVDTDFIRVYVESVKVNRLTEGAFDPTLGPLIEAWGFGKGHKATADTARIDSLMKFVGIDKTRLTMDTLVKDDSRIRFNFSAIAKGYGCDCVGEMLQRNGVEDWLIEIGGEISCRGKSPEGGKWRVSIDRPVMQKDRILHDSQCVVEVTDAGIATSGNYRNLQSDDKGRYYGHTISARTGRPARMDVISATVIGRTAMEADALATAFMAMGADDVKRLNKSTRLPVMLVLADSTVWCSGQFEKLMIR